MDQQDIESLIVMKLIDCDLLFLGHPVSTQGPRTTASVKLLDVLLPLVACEYAAPGRDLIRPVFLIVSRPLLDLVRNLVAGRHRRGLAWIHGGDRLVEGRVLAGMVVRHEIAHECLPHGLNCVVVSIFYQG